MLHRTFNSTIKACGVEKELQSFAGSNTNLWLGQKPVTRPDGASACELFHRDIWLLLSGRSTLLCIPTPSWYLIWDNCGKLKGHTKLSSSCRAPGKAGQGLCAAQARAIILPGMLHPRDNSLCVIENCPKPITCQKTQLLPNRP